VNSLSNALFELRVHVLMRIARLKNIEADETVIRQLAANRPDSLIMRELQARRAPLRRVWDWFRS
jgi:hypothetical protein